MLDAKFEFGFKVCRVCLTPNSYEFLSTMYTEKVVKMLHEVSGINILPDRSRAHDALICAKCLKDLRNAFYLRKIILRHDEFYFQPRRDKSVAVVNESACDKSAGNKTADDDSEESTSDDDDEDMSSSNAETPDDLNSTDNEEADRPAALETKEKRATIEKKRPKCPICMKSFATNSTLRRHHKKIHLNIVKFLCNLCKKFFYQKQEWMKHMKTVHDVKEPRFKCEVDECKMTFRTKLCLHVHKMRVHSEGIECKDCGKRLKKNALFVHGLSRCKAKV